VVTYNENSMILACTVLIGLQSVTDKWTDAQAMGIIIIIITAKMCKAFCCCAKN